MITPIISNRIESTYLQQCTSFKCKRQVQRAVEPSVRDIFKQEMVAVKMLVYAPFFQDVAEIFGRNLVYDYETGMLKAVERYKKKQLVEIKNFYPNTKKVQEIDEYIGGKISKMTGFRPDGKTIDWTTEYTGDKDVTKFFYSDGITPKSIQTELNDSSNRMQIKRFNREGRLIKTENYQDDVLIDDELYCNDFRAMRIYNNGKLASFTAVFTKSPVKSFIPEGDQRKNPLSGYVTSFDDNGKPIETTISAKKGNGESYISAIMTYPDKDTIKLTKFKENGKELYVEIINKRTGKRNVTYSKN